MEKGVEMMGQNGEVTIVSKKEVREHPERFKKCAEKNSKLCF